MSMHDVDPAVLSVSIPRCHITKSFVTYEIHAARDGVTWSVNRRYQEFVALHAAVKKYVHPRQVSLLPELPPKKVRLGMSKFAAEFMEDRRIRLEEYVQRLVAFVTPDKLDKFDDFLEYAEHLLQATIRRLSAIPELQHLVKFLKLAVKSAASERTRRNTVVSPRKTASSRLVMGGGGGVSTMGDEILSDDEDDDTMSSSTRQTLLDTTSEFPLSAGSHEASLSTSEIIPTLQEVVRMFRDYSSVLQSNTEDTTERANAARLKTSILTATAHAKEEAVTDAHQMIEILRQARAKECEKERAALALASTHIRTVAGELIRVQHDVAFLKAIVARNREAFDALRRLCLPWEKCQFVKAKGGKPGPDAETSTISEPKAEGSASFEQNTDFSLQDASFLQGSEDGAPPTPAVLDCPPADVEKLKTLHRRLEFTSQGVQLGRMVKKFTDFAQDSAAVLQESAIAQTNIHAPSFLENASHRFLNAPEKGEVPFEDELLSGINEGASMLLHNIATENQQLQHILRSLTRCRVVYRDAPLVEHARAPAAPPAPPAQVAHARNPVLAAQVDRSAVHGGVHMHSRQIAPSPGTRATPQFAFEPATAMDMPHAPSQDSNNYYISSRRPQGLPILDEQFPTSGHSHAGEYASPHHGSRTPPVTPPKPPAAYRSGRTPGGSLESPGVAAYPSAVVAAHSPSTASSAIPINRARNTSSTLSEYNSTAMVGSLPDYRGGHMPKGATGNPFVMESDSLRPSAGVLMGDKSPAATRTVARSLMRDNTFSFSRSPGGTGNPFG